MKPTFDEIRDLREEWEATLDVAEYRERLVAQIAAMEPGDPGRAELLACASEDSARKESSDAELVDAEALARAAIDDGGPTTIDPRAALVRVLLLLGRRDEAVAEVRAALRSGTTTGQDVGLHAALGEVLELAGEDELAQRVYTVGLRELDPNADEPDFDESLCLAGRYRIRRYLGAGVDAFDRCFEEDSPDSAAAIRDRVATGARPG